MDRPGKRNGLRLCAFTAACSYEDSSCDYFGTGRPQALRFVRSLIQRREAVENRHITFSGGTKLCRISSNAIYRALGVENIRHRRRASTTVVMRRLFVARFCPRTSGYELAPRRAGEGRVF